MPQKIKSYIDNFSARFQSLLNQASQTGQADEILEQLVMTSDELGRLLIELGQTASEKISSNKQAEDPVSANSLILQYIITHICSESSKIFMLLWRDSIFQIQKAKLFTVDGEGNEMILQQLVLDNQLVFMGAGKELLNNLHQPVENLKAYPNHYNKQLKKWLLQEDPWPSYEKQIREIILQCHTLHKKHLIILKSAQGFQGIKAKIFEAVKFCNEELSEVSSFINQATEFIQTETQSASEKSLTRIANKLQVIESQVNITYHIDVFNAGIEDELTHIAGETEFTIQTQNGLLMQARINFLKRLTMWLNREIFPLLFEVWEVTELNKNGLKMALQNIRNMALLSSSDTVDKNLQTFNEKNYLQPLLVLNDNNSNTISQLAEFSNIIHQRIAADFKLSLVYDPERYFLPFSSGTALTNRIDLGRIKLLKVSQSWFSNQIIRFHHFRKKVVQEYSLSRAEKMVRFIQVRQRDESNIHYTSFFITKGYFGDLFAIGRDEELAHLALLINNWREGFRGSVIITGQRFSGKTLTGELAASRNFPNNTIRLSPGVTLSLHGRKMAATYNIADSLEFIAKNREHSKYLIWIDDIELWWEPNIPLYRNIKELSHFIDHNSGHFFFMVSMNLSTYHHLKQVTELERIFQAHIHLGKLSAAEIEKAILIRHLATHRSLVNQKQEKVGPAEFRRISKAIAQASMGNIGDALNLWSYFIEKVDEEKVIFKNIPSGAIPDFYRPDQAILLTSVMLQKRTNEYRLRKLFGPAFTERYKPVLMRLISIGLIERQLDGWLEINERVVNEMGKMLDAKHYLTY
ncbi:MAG TPA: ATP-binding protein [Prolixibacteraceae bacterium]|nr:ATP-binding protein [Prolixibacteraceae bacterium]